MTTFLIFVVKQEKKKKRETNDYLESVLPKEENKAVVQIFIPKKQYPHTKKETGMREREIHSDLLKLNPKSRVPLSQ